MKLKKIIRGKPSRFQQASEPESASHCTEPPRGGCRAKRTASRRGPQPAAANDAPSHPSDSEIATRNRCPRSRHRSRPRSRFSGSQAGSSTAASPTILSPYRPDTHIGPVLPPRPAPIRSAPLPCRRPCYGGGPPARSESGQTGEF